MAKTNDVEFYIFYHNEEALSKIITAGMPCNFNLVDLRTLPIPERLRYNDLSEEHNRDLFSESLALFQIKPASTMVGMFTYSIPLKFSQAWADKTGCTKTFLPSISFSDFYGKYYETDKLYGVEFNSSWHYNKNAFSCLINSRKTDPFDADIRKCVKEIDRHPELSVGGGRLKKGPFKIQRII